MLKRVLSLLGIDLKRSLDGASAGRSLSKVGTINNLNADIAAGSHTIRRRTAYLARNNPHIGAAVTALGSNIVGTGIKPVSQHPNRAMRERLHDLWFRWTDQSDADGQGDFYAQQALMVRQMVEAGESFARFRSRRPEDELTVPFQVQVLHPSHLPMDLSPVSGGKAVRCGIEFDQLGRRVAYHFLPQRPDDVFLPYTPGGLTPVRVPASDVVHLMDPVEPGQLRGLSWLNPVVVPVVELEKFQAASLKRAQLSNMVVAALYSANGNPPAIPQGGGTADELVMEPGAFIPVDPGQSVEFFDPKESQHYGPYVKAHLRSIAAGLGVPYELLSGDLEGVNYSSIRAGLVEFRRRLDHWQFNVVVFRLCRPTWDRFITTAVLAGLIPADAYAANMAAFHRVEWLAPKQQWVDPLKDAQAEALMVRERFRSRSQVIASLGDDPERVDREIAADEDRAPAPPANDNPGDGNA